MIWILIMAALVFDGFDEYSTENDLWDYGDWQDSLGTTFASTVALREGASGKYARVTGRLSYKLPNDTFDGVIYMGAALYFDALPAADSRFISFGRTFNADAANEHASVGIRTTGEIYIQDEAGATTNTGTSVVAGQWYSINIRYLRDPAGSLEIRLDKVHVYTFAGDTENSADLTSSWIHFISTGYVPSSTTDENEALLVDDFYVFDATSSFSNTWGGNLFVETLTPTVESSAQFVPLSGTNTSNIDDGLVNDADVTYVETGTVGNRDVYTLANPLINIGTVYSVKTAVSARKTDVNAISMKIGVKAGTDEALSAAIAATDSFVTTVNYADTKDGGTTAFSASDIDSLESIIEAAT